MIRAFLALLLPLPLLFAACGEDAPPPKAGGPIVAGEPEKPVLEVTVVGPEDEPVPDVSIHAKVPFVAGAAGLEGISATTDEQGVARIDIEGRLAPRGDAPVVLSLRAEGWVPREVQIPGFRPGIGQRVTAKLEPSGVVTGRVVDGRGAPIEDAFVYLLRSNVTGFSHERLTFGARTDAEGSYRIEPAPGGTFDVGVRAKGYVPQLAKDLEVVPRQTVEGPAFALEPGGTISGRVVTPTGEPVADARVRVYAAPELADFHFYGRDAIGRTGGIDTTDEEGRFSVDGLPSIPFVVDTEKLGCRAIDAKRSDVTVGADDVRLVLERGVPISVRVMDAKTGRPVPEFRIVISEYGGSAEGDPTARTTPTSVDDRRIVSPMGVATITLRPGLRYRLEVAAEGHELRDIPIPPVSDGTKREWNVLLEPRK